MDRSTSVAHVLLMMRIHHLDNDYLTKRSALFNRVSCSDMSDVAKQLLDPARFVFAIVGGTPDIASPASAAAPAMGGDAR